MRGARKYVEHLFSLAGSHPGLTRSAEKRAQKPATAVQLVSDCITHKQHKAKFTDLGPSQLSVEAAWISGKKDSAAIR